MYELLWTKSFVLMRLGCVRHLSAGRGTRKHYLMSCLNDAHQWRLSSRRQIRARNSRHWPYCVCCPSAARVTIAPDDSRLLKISDWSRTYQVELIEANCCSKYHSYVLLSCRDNSTLNCFLCQTNVTLYQGQGHQHDHDHVCYAYVFYRHAKFESLHLSIVRDITIKLQVKMC